MNCQDITRILDDGDIGNMTEKERAEVEAHLPACPACAEDWKIHQRLATGFAPPLPAGLKERARAVVVAGRAGNARRMPSRAILFGTVMVAAAAAAMLGMQWMKAPAVETAPVEVAVPTQVLPPDGVGVPVAVTPAPQVLPAAAAAPATPPEPLAQPKPQSQVTPFTVRILALDAAGADARQAALLERFHNAFVQKLRGVPGLVLLTPESAGYQGIVDFEIRVAHQDAQGVPTASISTRSFAPMSPSSMVTRTGLESTTGRGPEGEAERMVEGMRARVFPSNPSLQQAQLAKLQNPRLETSQRLQALNDLLQSGGYSTGGAALDPAVIRGGVDLATTAPDPSMRESVWRMLRITRQPDLVAAAANALGTETDEKVRLELVTILGRDYRGQADARAALESVAQTDRQQIVRMAAQRVLTGDAGWNEYVVATLKNAELTDTQRLEPLTYMASSGLPRPGQSPLDDEAIRTLGSLLARMDSNFAAANGALTVLANARSTVARDVMIGFLLPGAGQPQADPQFRAMILPRLVSSFRDDPRARSVVEEIAARDPDPQLRDAARSALEMMERFSSLPQGVVPR